ncbi:hypothetical protein DL93DRAFT_2159326 [Clavulina sp. PMI_390]|nr:hypothetical protein DL93DRAFT_2159326 [Clavulina sp. PMI_390]
MNVSATVLASHDEIRILYQAWKMSQGSGTAHDVLTNHFRWRTAMYIGWKPLFIYPKLEQVLGAEAAQKDRELFLPAKDLLKELDKYVDEYSAATNELSEYPTVNNAAADPAVENLWAALQPALKQSEEVLPSFEAKLTKDQSNQLFEIYDGMRTMWAMNIAMPGSQRTHLFKNAGALLDTPVDELSAMFKSRFPEE